MFKTLSPLVLASKSPRRKRLLESVGIEFLIDPSEIDEAGPEMPTPAQAAENWALLKAAHASLSYPQSWVLAADTIVVLEGTIFGKPAAPGDAARMLRELAGRTHEVITGLCLKNTAQKVIRTTSVATRVRFKHLTSAEIRSYIQTGEPMDKAGAYGIQGIGAFLVESIEGSYTNVVGLPLRETVEWLMEEKVIVPSLQSP